MASSETKYNQSVGKALKIIEVLAQSIEPMRLMDIAAMADMPTSTTLRMITALMQYGYVSQENHTQKYFLTLKFARIGSMVASRFNIRDIVHPYLLKLSNNYKEASCMAIDDDMGALYMLLTGLTECLKLCSISASVPHCTAQALANACF